MNIVIKTWNGSDLDTYNEADITDICSNTFKEIAFRHMYDMDATHMQKTEDNRYSFTCTDQFTEDHGSISYAPYNGEYAVHILANINEYELITKEEYEQALNSEDEIDMINETDFILDDGEYFNVYIKLKPHDSN